MSYRETLLFIALASSLFVSQLARSADKYGEAWDMDPEQPWGLDHPVLKPDDREFDPRGLNGIWTRGHPGGGMGGPATADSAGIGLSLPRTDKGPSRRMNHRTDVHLEAKAQQPTRKNTSVAVGRSPQGLVMILPGHATHWV